MLNYIVIILIENILLVFLTWFFTKKFNNKNISKNEEYIKHEVDKTINILKDVKALLG
jgi:regulatory protein YycI of two-component signal transduction system YycFG